MAGTRRSYAREFREEMVAVVRSGRGPAELSREFEATADDRQLGSAADWDGSALVPPISRAIGPTTSLSAPPGTGCRRVETRKRVQMMCVSCSNSDPSSLARRPDLVCRRRLGPIFKHRHGRDDK